MLDVALNSITDAVIATGLRGRIVYENRAAERLTGWPLDEARQRTLAQVFFLVDETTGAVIDHPDGGPDVGAGAPPRQAVLVDRRGRQVKIEYAVAPGPDSGGGPAGAVVVCRALGHPAGADIQDAGRLWDEDALFEEKERAQVTLNSIGDAVISTNFLGRVNYLNVVAEKMTGWAQDEAAGNTVDDIFRLYDATTGAAIQCPAAQAIIENRKVSLEAVNRLGRRGEVEVVVEVSATPIHDRLGGVIGAVMVVHDVTAARELSNKLARLALHDTLTDLPNRALFAERLEMAIVDAKRGQRYAAVLYVDLDRFKHINDGLGHAVGDKLLQTVARRLQGCVRSTDTVSRQGGDEFIVLLPELQRVTDGSVCAEKILATLQAPYRIAEHELRMTASIGIATFPTDAAAADDLVRCADLAMYKAKCEGRNNYKCFAHEAQLDPID